MRKVAWAFLLVLVLGTGTLAAPEYTLKLGHLANESHTWHLGATRFAEAVERLSGGRITCKVYANEQLGKEMELISGIQTGVVHMTITGESMQNWAPKCALIAVPYMLRDLDHEVAVVDGEIGREIEAQIIEKVQVRPIAWFARSPRNLTGNRPIAKPEDLNGLKMRVPNVPLFVAVWQALGAKPTPMAFSEVFTSLQQNVIEGQENPVDLIRSATLYEVQSHINLTEHVYGWIYLVIGEQFFQKLPDDLKDAVLQAGKEAQAYERELWAADVEANEKFLAEKGMTFVEVDKPAFAKIVQPVVEDFFKDKPEVLELYKKIVKMGEK